MNRRCHPVLRTNLLGYDRSWNPLVYQIFGGSLGTSLDYPNLYRRPVGRQPEVWDVLESEWAGPAK